MCRCNDLNCLVEANPNSLIVVWPSCEESQTWELVPVRTHMASRDATVGLVASFFLEVKKTRTRACAVKYWCCAKLRVLMATETRVRAYTRAFCTFKRNRVAGGSPLLCSGSVLYRH